MTKEELDARLKYDPEAGTFKRLVKTRGRNGTIGAVVGTKDNDGYLTTCIDGKMYPLHRLAFLTMTGSIPKQVDHIDRDRANNRWSNLRPATISQNACNRDYIHKPKSGHRGVYFVAGKWAVRVKKLGKVHYGGRYLDADVAGLRASELRHKLHGEYALM